ncbi:MAG: hypothetical protein AAGA77_09135 [Bacteroidota bacterium]
MSPFFRYLILSFLFFSINQASAQFGIRAKYNMNSFSDWDQFMEQNINGDVDNIFSSTIEIGVDYWFRLKNTRIEFMPEVAMGLKTSSSFPNAGAETDFSYFAFVFNTQIYAFDLKGDCDCPTFSKQGPALDKGFFFTIAPGLIYNTKEIALESFEDSFDASQVNLRIGIGAGYDIGINDLITITPSILYNLTPGVEFQDLLSVAPTVSNTELLTTGLNQIQFQLRFGFRPDYVKSNR